MKWNSIEERVPDRNGTYLVATDNKAVCISHWYGGNFSGGHLGKHITHWAEMPEAPKEDEA